MKTYTKQELENILNLHEKWLAGEEEGERADLSWADLREADLSRADLSGANLDCSCIPLWCGSLSAHFDDRQLKQIAYHLVKTGLNSKNASEEAKAELRKLIPFANGFHRAKECGLIKPYADGEGWKRDRE